MKKNQTLIAGIVVVVVIVGGYLLLHKSSTTTKTSTSSTASVNNAILTTKTDPSLGKYLAASNGKPLYTYSADTSGVSNCTSSCLATWPAYTATSTSASLPAGVSTFKRTDNGQTQYTYNGKPLYYFVSDSSSGKPTGNGVENFSLAVPAAATSSTTNSSSSNSSSSTSRNPSNY